VWKRAALYLLISLLSVACAGECAEAVFSQDDQSIYAITATGLVQLNLESKRLKPIQTSARFDASTDHGVSISKAGYLLFAGSDGITAYNPVKQAWVPVCRAPQDTVCTNVAYNPADGSLVFETTEKKELRGYWLLPKNATEPIRLRLRRISYLSGFVFDSQGQLYFGYNGDLWAGGVCNLQDEPGTGYWICGIRIGPVADLETSIGTPSNQGVEETAPAGGLIYVQLHRLGGSGWGQIASLTAPAIKFDNGEASDDSLEKRIELYRDELKSVRLLGENGSYGYLCASRTGNRVFYRAQDPQDQKMKFWLVADGQTEALGDDALLGSNE
jgi:hypothetical protein